MTEEARKGIFEEQITSLQAQLVTAGNDARTAWEKGFTAGQSALRVAFGAAHQ